MEAPEHHHWLGSVLLPCSVPQLLKLTKNKIQMPKKACPLNVEKLHPQFSTESNLIKLKGVDKSHYYLLTRAGFSWLVLLTWYLIVSYLEKIKHACRWDKNSKNECIGIILLAGFFIMIINITISHLLFLLSLPVQPAIIYIIHISIFLICETIS